MKYRSKEVVDAIQFLGTENYYDVLAFIGREKEDKTDPEESVYVDCPGPLGDLQRTEVTVGEWVTKDELGLFDVYEADDFLECYEALEA